MSGATPSRPIALRACTGTTSPKSNKGAKMGTLLHTKNTVSCRELEATVYPLRRLSDFHGRWFHPLAPPNHFKAYLNAIESI